MSSSRLSSWIKGHELQAPTMQDEPVFYRNLEDKLDVWRTNHSFWSDTWKDRDVLDFSSNDTLSLGASGVLRAEFTKELSRHPTINFTSGGARSLPDGRYTYLEQVERNIANFHGAECGIIVGFRYEANVAIFISIPLSGDIIVYDEMIHASRPWWIPLATCNNTQERLFLMRLECAVSIVVLALFAVLIWVEHVHQAVMTCNFYQQGLLSRFASLFLENTIKLVLNKNLGHIEDTAQFLLEMRVIVGEIW
jgi:hypothetical protein